MKKIDKIRIIDKLHRKLWEMQGGNESHGMTLEDSEEWDSFGYWEIAEAMFKMSVRAYKQSLK